MLFKGLTKLGKLEYFVIASNVVYTDQRKYNLGNLAIQCSPTFPCNCVPSHRNDSAYDLAIFGLNNAHLLRCFNNLKVTKKQL